VTKRRRLVAALAALGVLAALPAVVFLWNLPDRRAGRIPGLSGPVTVTFDDRGVPRVVAASLGDALRAQGWLTASERAFQLELLRRSAAGELSALFGRVALEKDRLHRTYGFARVAAAAVPLLPPASRAELTALTDGVNAYLASHRGRAGVELTILRVPPHTWTLADSLMVLLLMHEDLSARWKVELENERIAKLPPSLRDFLLASRTSDDVTLVPDAAPLPPVPLPDLGGRPIEESARVNLDEPEPVGSNAWAVSGALTKSGRPLLANDPHLGLTIPGIWLPLRFEIAGRSVEGVTLPGLPGVILGRNDRIAWGFTNLCADVMDLYREDSSAEFRTRVELIDVKGGAPERFVVRETRHGPLVDATHALRWLALEPARLRMASPLMLTSSVDELQKALDDFPGPPQNVIFASADGHVGWRAAGVIPIRRAGTDGSLPYDGNDPENDWKGVVPASEMPRVLDPPSGYVATANQRVTGTSYPHVVATEWPSPVRARRIRDLLEEARRKGEKLDSDAMERIQRDVVSAELRAFVTPFLPYAGERAGRLGAWDGSANAGDDLTLFARTLRKIFRERALKAWSVAKYTRFPDEEAWTALASADEAAFRRAGLGEKALYFEACVKETLVELRKRFGADERRWTWGDANRLAVKHPLGYVPGLAWLFDPPHPPQSGSGGTVKASTPTYGPSMRFVVDWGEPENATLVVPFGVSGHILSPHRLDQLRFWLNGGPGGSATRLDRPAAGATLELLPEITSAPGRPRRGS
jgi:penicillin amidase